jgi:MFS family permease
MNHTAFEALPWRRHLVIVTLGSFMTVSAMGLALPFLPLFLGQLGVHETRAVASWSGIAYAASFLSAGLTAPLWGWMGDRWGRKPMMLRASLGLAVAMALTGLAQNEWQLLAARLLTGLLGGYSSGAVILVAAQAPKERSGWALGILSSGATAGLLAGPLLGGVLPPLIGIRNTFLAAGAAVFISFLATWFGLRRDAPAAKALTTAPAFRSPIIPILLVSGLLITGVSLTIEPVLALYVGSMVADQHFVTTVAGLVFAATAAGSLLSAAFLGKLADKVGPSRVLVGSLIAAGLLVLPQAFVADPWQLGTLRFLLGCALGGLGPSLTATLRRAIPADRVGRVLGLQTSAQYAGQVAGPVTGGFLAGWGGVPAVLLGTGVILFVVAAVNVILLRRAFSLKKS